MFSEWQCVVCHLAVCTSYRNCLLKLECKHLNYIFTVHFKAILFF